MSSQLVPFSWQQVDETLATLMLAEVSTEFGNLLREDTQHIRYQNIGNGNGLTVPLQRLEMHRLRTDELAARYYAVYCEVWRSQQKPLTPGFLRAICPNRLRVLMSARVNGVSSEFSQEQARSGSFNGEWLKSAMEEFRRSMDRLYAKWEKLAEIDAKGLEHLLAAAPNSPDVDTVATEVVHARIQLRIVEARLASIEALIVSCGRALSATQLRQPDNYRIKSLEQRLEGLKADKKQFELRRDDWQRSQETALRRSAELRRQNVSNSFFDEEVQGASGEFQSREQEYRVEPSANPEPNCAGTVGPEREIAQARERVRHFEAEIAAVDTKIAAFQQSLTEAIVHGTSTIKPRDIDKVIRKLHADKKDLEFRRDDWQLNLNTALSHLAGGIQQSVRKEPNTTERHAIQMTTSADFSDVTALQDNAAPSVETGSEPAISPRQSPAADESRVPSGPPSKKEKLPAKTADLSQYLDEAQLTDRQRECFSLKFEYGLRFSAIANRLGISRKTVDEHIAAARRRMEWSKVKNKIQAKKARLNPEE
jgi:predicted DNA-binding protein (UPF0251 family)